MDNTLNCRQNILHRLAMGIFGLWCFFIVWRNLVMTGKVAASYSPSYRILAPALMAAGAIAVVLICWFMSVSIAKKRSWKIFIIIFLISLAAKMFTVFVLAPAEYSDFQTFRAGAALTAQGDVSFIERLPYYKIWAYQFGIEFLIAPIFRFFGKWDPVFGLVVNGFIAAACSPLIYAIGENIISKGSFGDMSPSLRRSSVFAALLFTFLPITIDLSAVFTNQQLSLFFILLSIYLFLALPWWIGGVLSGIALGLANVARADAVVYLAAFAVAVILLRRSKKSFISLACLIVFYFLSFKAVELLASPLQPYGLGNNFTLYKFAVGLDEQSLGRYSVRMQEKIFNNEAYLADHALRDRETLALIREELSIGPSRLAKLFLAKIDIQWAGYGHSYEMLHDVVAKESYHILGKEIAGSSFNRAYGLWDRATSMLLFAAAGVSGIMMSLKKRIHIGISVMDLAFMAFSVIAFVIEVQYRYSYFVYPGVVITAALLPQLFRREAEDEGPAPAAPFQAAAEPQSQPKQEVSEEEIDKRVQEILNSQPKFDPKDLTIPSSFNPYGAEESKPYEFSLTLGEGYEDQDVPVPREDK